MTRGHGSSALHFVLRLLLVACALVSPAVANTIHVPADQKTIQAGIDAANNGDTVLVAPGTYYENIDFKGKAITVTSSGGAAATIIDGGSNGPVVTFQSGEPRATILSAFTIQHGGYGNGNYAFTGNGGIWLKNSAPTISGNVITQNLCWDIYAYPGGPLIQNNEISATQSPPGGCGFGSGAGIYIGGDFQPASPNSNTSIPALITGNTIENNVLSGLSDAGGNGGGGIAIWGGSPMILNNILRNNASPGGSGGAINLEGGLNVVIEQNLIYGNSAGCGGGALAFNGGGDGPATLLIANNTIADNTGTDGAGYSECIAISQMYPSPDGYGGSGPTVVIVNNIIAGSSAAPAVDCEWFYTPTEASQPIFDHNLLFNAGGAFFGSYCIDVSSKYGNIAVDPQFNDPANNDFHLRSTSPAIDSGNNSVSATTFALTGTPIITDFDGNPRVQDATDKGYPVIDMGAYESSGRLEASPTTILLTASAYTGPAGSNFVLTANAASPIGTPTGSVDYYLDGKKIGTSAIGNGGLSTLPNVTITPGVHSLYASYPGEGNFPPAVSIIVVVNIDLYSTSLILTSSSNPSIVGQPVTFTVISSSADVNYVPSPVVLISQSNNVTLTTLTPNSAGFATYTTSSLAIGDYLIEAAYAGDATHTANSTEILQEVVDGYGTTIALSSSTNPSNVGQSVTFNAQVTAVTGVPTGTVTFADGQTTLGTQPLTSAGTAAFTTASLASGQHNIEASYHPTGGFKSSSSGLTQTVDGLASVAVLKVSPQATTAGSPVTLTATVAPATPPGTASPSGTVAFTSSGVPIGSAVLTAGTASLTLGSLPVGTDQIACQYSGDNVYSGSPCNIVPVTVTGAPTTLTLSSSANPSPAFAPVTLTARISSNTSTPAGNIAFFSNGVLVGTSPLSAAVVATLSVNFPAGSDSLTATYAATGNFNAATSNTIAELVAPDATTISLAVSPNPAAQNSAVTLTAQITPASSQSVPVGSVVFFDGTANLGTVPVSASGGATFTSSSFAVGTHTLTAIYSGSVNDLTSTSAAQTLTIFAESFTINAPPSVTLKTEYHTTVKLSVTSIGSFADTVNLSCVNLPQWATCSFDNASPALGENQTIPASIYVDTDAVLGYRSALRTPFALRTGIALALLMPLGLVAGGRRGKLLRRSTLLMALTLSASLVSLCGCSGLYPSSVAPGTYIVTLAGQGVHTGISSSTTLTLVVTP